MNINCIDINQLLSRKKKVIYISKKNPITRNNKLGKVTLLGINFTTINRMKVRDNLPSHSFSIFHRLKFFEKYKWSPKGMDNGISYLMAG